MRNLRDALVRPRGLLLAMSVVVGMALAIPPATGVVNGDPDFDHPYVGTMVLKMPDGSLHYWCSGTMVTPTVFVAAGHCMLDWVRQGSYPGSELKGVTVDAVVDSDTEALSGQAQVMPSWPGKGGTQDFGVFILDKPIAGLVESDLPVLPDVGQVDDLVGHGTKVTIVGYGWDRARTGGPNGLDPSAAGTRRVATERVVAVTPLNLHLLSTIAAGASGMCYGDSGAPRLLSHEGATYLVATSWWLGTYCQAPERPLRTDARAVHAWLQSVIDSAG